MRLHRDKTDFSTVWVLSIAGHEFMLGHLAAQSAVNDAAIYGEENVNDRLNRAPLDAEPNRPVEATQPALNELSPHATEPEHDPFPQGRLTPKQLRAAIKRIELEIGGPFCTTTCGARKCHKARARLNKVMYS